MKRSDAVDVAAAYQAGHQTFMGLEIEVAQGVLVPRPETELVGRAALETLGRVAGARPGAGVKVIDMCCGSGNLACAIAASVPLARVWACDLSPSSIDLSRRNAERLGLSDRLTVRGGDLFEALRGEMLEQSIDLIVCNPPYISSGRLRRESAPLLELEPQEAFDGGPYGIAIQQRVVNDALAFLHAGGGLVLEFGVGQHNQVMRLFARAKGYEAAELVGDTDGNPRVVIGIKH